MKIKKIVKNKSGSGRKNSLKFIENGKIPKKVKSVKIENGINKKIDRIIIIFEKSLGFIFIFLPNYWLKIQHLKLLKNLKLMSTKTYDYKI